ncbi:MAG: Gfo/Idh/MocA family oxidoreductase [Gammaproteobacteria bacterium]|nr:Gfo/Idh/MocA family oxidoreductase [Gammaproteobacteria bacterium]
MGRLSLGFVGGGQGGLIGEVHANGARLSNRWTVVAGALSSNPDNALKSGRAWMLDDDRIYTDYRDMAEREGARDDGIDAVVIATPNYLHHPVAMAFMDQGIHIISDKPLTLNSSLASELVEKQKQTGVIFALTYAYASHVMVRQARAMVKQGLLGELRQIHVEYLQEGAIHVTDEGAEASPWRLDPEKNGPSFTVADIGTHAIQLAEFASTLKSTSLRADFHVTGAAKSMEDTAFMNLKFQGNVPGTLIVSQAAAGTHCGLRVRLFGTKAGLEWNQEAPETLAFMPIDAPCQTIARGYSAGMDETLASQFVRMPRGHPEALTDAWANLYLEVADAIDAHNSGCSPSYPLEYPNVLDGAHGVRFVEAAIQSNHEDRWVDY